MKQWMYRGIQAYTKPMMTRFQCALTEPDKAQHRVLANIVSGMSKTDYGKAHGIDSIERFKSHCPIVTYDELSPWMDQQRATEKQVIVPGKVKFYEKTSGSTGPQKYIPYTKALRSSFTHMFLLWCNNLVTQLPQLAQGKLYFSVSPNFDTERMTDQGVPVGLEDDADYLGGVWRKALSPFLHTDPAIGQIREPEAFKKQLAFSLIQCPQLSAVSVWNPTFMLVVMQWIEAHRDTVLAELGQQLCDQRRNALRADPIDWQTLWPKLALISCWADGNAAPMADKLQQQFPDIYVQGKGLLATEAPMTIPLVGIQGGVPLVEQTYFEFQNSAGELLNLNQLKPGERYEIIISQQAGLCRYRMGDEVEVVDYHFNTPTLGFVGRNNRTSDLVGEKLNESFVGQVIEQLPIKQHGFRALLATRQPQDGYVLLLDKEPENKQVLAAQLEAQLQQAYHYHHARALGQLSAATVMVIPDIENRLSSHRINNQKSLGDMKQNYLILENEAPGSMIDITQQQGMSLC